MVVWNKQNPLDDRLFHTANDARSSSSSSNQSEHGDTRTGSSPLAVPGRRWGSPCSLSRQLKFARLRTFTHFNTLDNHQMHLFSSVAFTYEQWNTVATTVQSLLYCCHLNLLKCSGPGLECVPLPLSRSLVSFFVGFEFFFHFCFYNFPYFGFNCTVWRIRTFSKSASLKFSVT